MVWDSQLSLVFLFRRISCTICRYLKRFDDEVEQINLKQSISKNRGNQHASRLSIIKMTLERENAEYIGGGIGKILTENIVFHNKRLIEKGEWK